MFKFINKKLIDKNNSIQPREVMTNFFITDKKTNLKEINQEVFQEIENVKNKNDNTYINTNSKKFKHLLLTNQYVDFKYLALQLYLLQNDVDGFKYWEIKKLLSKIIGTLENVLLEWRSISISDKIYITFSHNNKLKIKDQFVPRIYIQKEKPKGPIFSIDNIKIDFHGIREVALYTLVIKNFNELLIELLDRVHQVLLGDMLIIKINSDYAVIPSGKFLFGSKNSRDLSKTLKIAQSKISKKPISSFTKSSLKPNKSIYQTQQIFLGKQNKKFRNFKFNIKNKLLSIKKTLDQSKTKQTDKIKPEENKIRLNASKLQKEIKDISSKIKDTKKGE